MENNHMYQLNEADFRLASTQEFEDIAGKEVLDCNGRLCGRATKLNYDYGYEPFLEYLKKSFWGRKKTVLIKLDLVTVIAPTHIGLKIPRHSIKNELTYLACPYYRYSNLYSAELEENIYPNILL